jgi:uncharacterized protein YlxW (UPF0749 family)
MPDPTPTPDAAPDSSPKQPPTQPPTQPPGESGDPGRQRILAAVRTPSRAQLVVAVLLAVLGFAAVTQVRSNDRDDTYAGKREQDRIDLLNGLAGTSQRSQNEIDRLEQTRANLQDSSNSRQAALLQAQKDAATLNILAGLVKATGEGLRVTIEDPEGSVDVDIILDTIEELRTAGAEAIEFNDTVRVIAQTSFDAGVGGTMIDGTLVSPPYVIDVIGDPHALETGLTFLFGPQDDVEDQGGTLTFQELDNVQIDAVRQPVRPEFAEPGTTP